MNKAFIKEDSDSNDFFDLDFDFGEEDTALDQNIQNDAFYGGPKNYITNKGFERLKSEMEELIQTERPKIADLLATLGGKMGLTTNEEIFEAKKRLRETDRRIRFLHRRIDIAEVVTPEDQTGDRVLFGATVTVLDEDEKTRVYRIVGVDESDVKSGKVSWISPIGQALLQAKVGDFVILRTPSGEEELEVTKIEFKSID